MLFKITMCIDQVPLKFFFRHVPTSQIQIQIIFTNEQKRTSAYAN